MPDLKEEIKNLFCKEIDRIENDTVFLSKDMLEFKLNGIIENVLDRINFNKTVDMPYRQTSNENIYDDDFNIEADTYSEYDFNEYRFAKNNIVSKSQPEARKFTIPANFSLSEDMIYFAKAKTMPENEITLSFDKFKAHYESTKAQFADWEAVWKKWVLNHNEFRNHLPRKAMNPEYLLTGKHRDIAKKYINPNDIEEIFESFKSYYIAKGIMAADWNSEWENWCKKSKQFEKNNQKTKASQEKQDYKWNFKKAKEVSDKIKEWLEFEKGIDWLEDFYLQDIPIPGIGWQEVQHPDFNKEEILLYKIDSPNGKFMLQHKSEDIIDAEVLEND